MEIYIFSFQYTTTNGVCFGQFQVNNQLGSGGFISELLNYFFNIEIECKQFFCCSNMQSQRSVVFNQMSKELHKTLIYTHTHTHTNQKTKQKMDDENEQF